MANVNLKPALEFQRGLSIFSIIFACVLIYSNYYYYYFFEFSQGLSSAPGQFFVLKSFGVAFFFLVFFYPFRFRRLGLDDLILILFLFVCFFYYLFKRFYVGQGAALFGNFLIPACIFVFFESRVSSSSLRFFFDVSVFLVVMQVVIDFLILWGGISLWDNLAFVGGVGNPSSFGVICVILIAYVLLLKKIGFICFLQAAILAVGVIGSKSLFCVVALVFVFLCVIWFYSKSIFLFSLLLSPVVLGLIWGFLLPEHVKFKLFSLYGLLVDGDLSGASQSISLRYLIHEHAIEHFAENYFYDTFFGYLDLFYYGVDSQVLSFIGSVGLLPAMIFVLWNFYLIFSNYLLKGEGGYFLLLSSLVFFFLIFSNRIFDYYPVAFLFFILMFFRDRIAEFDRR